MEGTGWCAAVALFAFLCLAKCAKKRRPAASASALEMGQGNLDKSKSKGSGVQAVPAAKSETSGDGTTRTKETDPDPRSMQTQNEGSASVSLHSKRKAPQPKAEAVSKALPTAHDPTVPEPSTVKSGMKTRRTTSGGLTTISLPGKNSSTTLTVTEEREPEDAGLLSDYDAHEGHADGAGKLPEIPDSSHLEEEEERKPLRFSNKGRVRPIPRDQTEPWGVERSRLLPNPERRAHVIRTIEEMGGWVLDRNATGQKRNTSYVFVAPKPTDTSAPVSYKPKDPEADKSKSDQKKPRSRRG